MCPQVPDALAMPLLQLVGGHDAVPPWMIWAGIAVMNCLTDTPQNIASPSNRWYCLCSLFAFLIIPCFLPGTSCPLCCHFAQHTAHPCNFNRSSPESTLMISWHQTREQREVAQSRSPIYAWRLRSGPGSADRHPA